MTRLLTGWQYTMTAMTMIFFGCILISATPLAKNGGPDFGKKIIRKMDIFMLQSTIIFSSEPAMHITADTSQPQPQGKLTLQTVSMPADTNPYGDIFGGWLLSQMDIAGAVLAQEIARGRVITVAISSMAFLHRVPVGALVSCYSQLVTIGNTSIRVGLEVWIKDYREDHIIKVTQGEFIYVAIDEQGKKRKVKA